MITFSQGKRQIIFASGVPVPMVGRVTVNNGATFDVNKNGAVRQLVDLGLEDGMVAFTPLNFWIEDSANRLVHPETDNRTYTVTGNVVNFCFRNEGPQEKVLYVQRYDRHGNVIPYFEAILPPQKEWVQKSFLLGSKSIFLPEPYGEIIIMLYDPSHCTDHC